MFVVDAFIVNVALPTIAADLRASAAQIQAVIAVNLIGYATLVITGAGSVTSTVPSAYSCSASWASRLHPCGAVWLGPARS